ncbi:MAG: hydroxypyruvate isomerase, partial [Candidatus Accumulibacter sp.]|nr:hydroxypyruvate isomerase [Accumulibacter sp.]
MPKFAANLSMMFTEVPFPERFAAAARAGFEFVEFL